MLVPFQSRQVAWWMVVAMSWLTPAHAQSPQPLQPRVEVEETAYTYQPADNGAGPMWCSGSTSLVRGSYGVAASGLETLPDVKPLNNCRWMLLHRTDNGWQTRYVDQQQRTREPSPLATFHDGRVLLSANPTLAPRDAYGGPARPELWQFDLEPAELHAQTTLPKWQGTPEFTEHSYRSLAADGGRGELVLFQNIGYGHAEWAFRDDRGEWSAAGQLVWPWGAEYDQPQPIRICYPNVMLKNRAVHFCGVSDIVEPYEKWRAYKKELTGREWDFDFRRLFYTWSDDIVSGDFHSWVEIASRDATCGWIGPCDLWVGDDGRVHVLWTERALDERLRARFFPEAKQSYSLNYAILQSGQVLLKRSLIATAEGQSGEIVGAARFQVTPDGRLCVVYFAQGTDEAGNALAENRVLEIHADGSTSPPVTIPFQNPFVSFFTATVRGGSPRSHIVDLLGIQPGSGQSVRYARVRLW